MKYKTLFRLMIKAVGVWFCVEGIVGLATSASHGTLVLSQGSLGIEANFAWISLATGSVMLGLGLYLFFGGNWVVNMAIPSNRPYCPECAYDLTGAVSDRCPECGMMLNQELLRSSNDQPE